MAIVCLLKNVIKESIIITDAVAQSVCAFDQAVIDSGENAAWYGGESPTSVSVALNQTLSVGGAMGIAVASDIFSASFTTAVNYSWTERTAYCCTKVEDKKCHCDHAGIQPEDIYPCLIKYINPGAQLN